MWFMRICFLNDYPLVYLICCTDFDKYILDIFINNNFHRLYYVQEKFPGKFFFST